MLCCDKHRSDRVWFSRTEIYEPWSSRKGLSQNTEMWQSMKRIVIPGQRSSKNVAKRSLAPLHRCQRAGKRQPVTSAIHQSSSKLQSCPPYPLPRNYLRDLAVL